MEHRTGFIPKPLWFGPFALPQREDVPEALHLPAFPNGNDYVCPPDPFTPHRVSPERLRARGAARERNVVIRQRRSRANFLPETPFTVDDIDFGPAVRVLEILYQRKRRIKVRIELKAFAPQGVHHVTVREAVGPRLFSVLESRR